MSFITLANVLTIIFSSDLKNIDLKKRVYKKEIYFFSKYEENELLAIQELLLDPKKYFSEIYRPRIIKDTYKYVYEGKKPSYHGYFCCPRLLSDYQNFEVPRDIREEGKDAVTEFRKWFGNQKHLLPEKSDIFAVRLHARWGIITNPRAIDRPNSGAVKFENIKIEDLEKRIDSKIKAAGRFYYKNEKNNAILKRFSKLTHLAKKEDVIYGNDTDYSDQEVKDLLKNYDKQFKSPLKTDLIEYYRLHLNPEIKMEGLMLERLGFRKCGHCHHPDYRKKEVITNYGNDTDYSDQEVKDMLKDYERQLV